jgi:predicted ATPase
VVSAYPIVIGLNRLAENGMLIVEEPEAHLEPRLQMELMKLITNVISQLNGRLVLTTHSDLTVKSILAKVGRGEIPHNELGLFYFERHGIDMAKVRQIEVDESGDAEQPLFQEAIESLVKEYSEKPSK